MQYINSIPESMYNMQTEAIVTGIRDTEKRAIIDIDVNCGNNLYYAGEIGVWRTGKFDDIPIFTQFNYSLAESDRVMFKRTMEMVTFLRSMCGIAPYDRDFDNMGDISRNLPFLMDLEHWEYNIKVLAYRAKNGYSGFQPIGYFKRYKPVANEVRMAYMRGYRDAVEKLTGIRKLNKKSKSIDIKTYGEDYLRLYDSMSNIPEPVPEITEEPVYPSEKVRSMV